MDGDFNSSNRQINPYYDYQHQEMMASIFNQPLPISAPHHLVPSYPLPPIESFYWTTEERRQRQEREESVQPPACNSPTSSQLPPVIKKDNLERFRCPYCLCSRTVLTSLRQHIRMSHPEHMSYFPFDCGHCSKRFETVSALKSHQRKSQACNAALLRAGVVLPPLSSLSSPPPPRNVKPPTPSGPRLLTCNFCSRLFSYEKVLRNHIHASHQENLLFPCDACPKRFLTLHSKRLHEAKAHDMVNKNRKKTVTYTSEIKN